MSPRQFLAGLTWSLAVTGAFYAWLLYSILKLSLGLVLALMGPVAAVETVAAVYGYRTWLDRNRRLVPTTTSRGVYSPLIVTMYLIAVGIPTFGAIYLLGRGFWWIATLVSLGGGAIAAYGLTQVARAHQLRDTAGVGAWASRPAHGLGLLLIAFYSCTPLLLGMAFVGQREFGIALGFFLLGGVMLLWAIRKIKKGPGPR